MIELSDCYELHKNSDKQDQKKHFQKVSDIILGDGPSIQFGSVILGNIYELVCNNKICIYDACYSDVGDRLSKALILTISVICEAEEETFVVPVKIRLNTADKNLCICPDVFLFYDQNIFVNPAFKYINKHNNTIVTPYMQSWTTIPNHSLIDLVDNLISVFSECSPLLHSKENCTHYIPLENIKKGEMLGSGACGRVYSGLYNEHEVAIKECIITKESKDNRNTVDSYEQLLKELDILSRLNHECIIRNYGYSKCTNPENPEQEILTFVMQKADCDLEAVIGKLRRDGQVNEDRHKISIKFKKIYILQIATGLLYLFKKKVNHADLKIDNILIVNGNCKIADFGVSKLLNDMSNANSLTVSTIGPIGNCQHRAPELALLNSDEPKSPVEIKKMLIHADVYAFGILTSEILTGCQEIYAYLGDKRRELSVSNWEYSMEKGYRFRPNELLKKDMEIYNIVKDCLKDEKERPSMVEVYKRVEAWTRKSTPEI